MKRFWSNASGSYKIDPEALHEFLKERGYWSFKPINVETKILVSEKNRKVRQVSHNEIREYCWNYIVDNYPFQNDEERKQVKSEFISHKSFFSIDNMRLLPEIKINEIKDTKDMAYLFFNNCILEITGDSITKKSYDEVEGHVFESDVINYDFTQDIPNDYKPSGVFYEFMKDVTVNKSEKVQDQNLTSLITIIGYMLHRYKDPTNARAIIIMDTQKDGNPNGGTGKGLFTKAFNHMRHTVSQDGKVSSSGDKFRLSDVKYGTRVLVFDDVPKTFEFEKIFPLITEKAVVERKYENKFSIPFEESPKILITTNYTIEGQGVSNRRRKVEFIFSDTYDDVFTPEDKFGHLLFIEWDEEEWSKFFMLMVYSLQMFLLYGILKPKFNVTERRLKLEASKEFIEFITVHDSIYGDKFNKKKVYEEFYSKYPEHHRIELNTFTKWLKLFAEANDLGFHESHSGDELFFEFTWN